MNPRRRLLAALAIAGSFAPSALAQATNPRPSQAPAKGAPVRKDAGVGKAQNTKDGLPPKAAPNPEAERKMEALLARWAEQSKLVTSLSVVPLERVDESKLFDVKKTYTGKARLKSPDFVYLDFIETVNGQPKNFVDERIVCDGKNVYQFVGSTRRIWVFPLDQDPRRKALNQGPLPFLFDMTVAKAHQRYEMEYLREDARTYFVRIIPKLAIDREEFSMALIDLDKATFLPAKIRLTSPEGNGETKTFTFDPAKMAKNVKITESWFDGPTMIADATRDKKLGWSVTYNKPDSDPKGPANAPLPRNAAPAAGTVGAKPAAKGAGIRQR